jgi:hypothetical protein
MTEEWGGLLRRWVLAAVLVYVAIWFERCDLAGPKPLIMGALSLIPPVLGDRGALRLLYPSTDSQCRSGLQDRSSH